MIPLISSAMFTLLKIIFVSLQDVHLMKCVFFSLSQQQMETRVGWVVEELKKCSILPDDVYVDSRLFAMRSADHVSYSRLASIILTVSCKEFTVDRLLLF